MDEYRGRKSTTIEGNKCVPWKAVSQYINEMKSKLAINPLERIIHGRYATVIKETDPLLRETHNYCRSGKKALDADLWCYTSRTGDTEMCDVRDCMECDSGELEYKIQQELVFSVKLQLLFCL